MNKSKIDWTDYSWNPVTGCRHNCPYCYARTMSRRFSGDVRLNKAATEQYEYDEERDLYILEKPFISREDRALNYPFGFEPTLHKYRLDMPEKLKTSKKIFVGSMTDLFGEWVPDEWIKEVFEACKKAPQHRYLFLTKNPKRYGEINGWNYKYDWSFAKRNWWFGLTITNTDDLALLRNLPYGDTNAFVSIEPISSSIDFSFYTPTDETRWKCSYCGHLSNVYSLHCQNCEKEGGYSGSFRRHPINWIIIGAETGSRKGKVVPKKEWIMSIKEQCKNARIPLFMKESLRELMGKDFIQEYPEELEESNKVPKNTPLYKKLYTSCGICKEEGLKSEMVALLVRGKRGSSAKHLIYLCTRCLGIWCKTLDIDIPDIELEEE